MNAAWFFLARRTIAHQLGMLRLRSHLNACLKLTTQAIRRPSAQLFFSCALALVSAFRKCAISTFQKQQHACLPHGSQFPASAFASSMDVSLEVQALPHAQHVQPVTHSILRSACLKLTTQAVRRPLTHFFTSCMPALNNAFL